MEQALFERDGAGFVATNLSRGPWSPNALHGGPVAALMAMVAESVPTLVPMATSRLTVEMFRPVPPHRRLDTSVNVVREGKKIQLVDAFLHDNGVELARARMLRIRTRDIEFPEGITVDPAFAGPEGLASVMNGAEEDDGFHTNACEFRYAAGAWEVFGPVKVWIRMRVPVVLGEEPSALQRVAGAADFGNGVSAILPWEQYTFINPELTIHLNRPLVGEWVGLDTKSHLSTTGLGFAESALYDPAGRLGRSVQGLLVDQL